MSAVLSPQNKQRLSDLRSRYQDPQSLVLEALWMWQEEHGWISDEGMKQVADLLGIPCHHVYGVVTFYTMYNTKPVGKHKIEVCTNVSCMLRGCSRILHKLEERLGVGIGETTADNRYTVVEAECLGSCGTAPMMQVGDEYYENLTEDKVDAILAELT